ncbi:MAG TPA: hypothetical protein DEG17_21285 [Cyanobacteria bacterium UBA11149]|nr:hypothetical protein [Cyanobacteria bacterium UBA11367]HBE55940.1 hypothetical protein [Cyanobacteria bacterium UBA11366]HBK63656.1 hypothetical protein [Cyanobacteria bacterium UBA11166]HBR77155.1 hypothetical protein [Cyanobacteria bacterium UBA11159]HBS68652.1 hypothetical protein [Cyanobacteria bacterium UBA11153]HBW91322.1 hypothetical protein [Cyanobacteria bacterium UBA11149]HCA93632.1 hypothetical protein [Cyanobacteria bacterium UBA9226]
MTGKVIDNSANGILILLLPVAFAAIFLFEAWPYLLALLIVTIIIKVWQEYQWQQWSQEVNPFFNQLIKENQGCLTALDLAMKAQISGAAAERYLDKKAEEFGAKRQVREDKSTIYYFLTASALGSLFESSEPPMDTEAVSLTNQAPKLVEILTDSDRSSERVEPEKISSIQEVESQENFLAQVKQKMFVDEDEETKLERAYAIEKIKREGDFLTQVKKHLFSDDDDILEENAPEVAKNIPQSLIQGELAKRLDVHSSTVGKRKSDSDFSQWSKSKDPDGIAWKYSPKTKEFLPLNENP